MQRSGGGDSGITSIEPWASTVTTSSTSCDKPGFGSFGDQPPLEMGKSREDVEDQFSAGRRGVDGSVTNGAEADALSL